MKSKIVVPVYYIETGNKKIVDEHSIREEFEQKLTEAIKKIEKDN